MSGVAKCDIILPVCDQFGFTRACVESIIEKTKTPYRLIVINNGRDECTKKYLRDVKNAGRCEIDVIENETNVGWVRAINKGIEMSNAPYVCFQNDDTIVTEDWLGKMIAVFEKDERVGIVNPTWEGKPKRQDIDTFAKRLEKRKGEFIEMDWARGFCVLVKRQVIDRIGGLDDIYSPAYFDDVDFSVRAIEAGFLCVRSLDTYVHHYRNKTFFEVLRGPRWNEIHERNKLIYYKRWGRPLKIALILRKEAFRDTSHIDGTEELALGLARKQHRIYIYSPRSLNRRFAHTNIIKKVYPAPIFGFLAYLDIKIDSTKGEKKRYDAVFEAGSGRGDSLDSIKEKAARLKEKTKMNIL